MVKKFKRIIALMMMVVLSTSSLISCGKDEKTPVTTTENDYITRGEWITQLGEAFGMNEYDNQEPYYEDVTKDSEIFPYVQSCYEWDILSTQSKDFKPDEIATLGFVVSTAVLAAELDYENYATSDDVNESIINCANAYELTNVTYKEQDKLTAPVEKFGAASILDTSVSHYVNNDSKDIFDIAYRDTVIDTTQEPFETLSGIGENKNVSAIEADMLEVGSILLMPGNEENPFGYSLKVVSKSLNSDGTYTVVTEQPEIYEVFESIDIDTDVTATPEMFEPAEGVTVLNNKQANNITNLNYTTNAAIINSEFTNKDYQIYGTGTHKYEEEASGGIELSLSYNSDGKLEANKEYKFKVQDIFGQISKVNISEQDPEKLKRFEKALESIGSVSDDFNDENDYSFIQDYMDGKISEEELEKNLENVKKKTDDSTSSKSSKIKPWKTGWKITGTLSLETSVNVTAKIHFTFFDTIPDELKEFSVTVTNKCQSEIEYKGTGETSKTLGTLTIPLGAGFGIKLKAEAFFEANGTMKVGYSVESIVKAEYKDGDFKKANTNKKDGSFEAGLEFEGGVKLSGTLTFWGIGLAEVGAKISGKVKVESAIERSFEYGIVNENGQDYYEITDKIDCKSSAKFFLPLVSFTLGGDDTLLGWLGVELEYEALSEKNAPHITLWDYSSDDKNESLVLYTEKIPINSEETTTEETSAEETSTEETSTEETSTEETTTEAESAQSGPFAISDFAISLSVGDTYSLTVTLPDGYTADNLIWSTDNSSVIIVSNGSVTAKAEGSANVTATTSDGKYSATCYIVVNE